MKSVFNARQDVSTTQVENLTKILQLTIENGGGGETWCRRSAHPGLPGQEEPERSLCHAESGETDPDTLAEYERIMGLNEDVLRFMNIAIEEVEEGPSIAMQAASQNAADVASGPHQGVQLDRSDAANDDKTVCRRNG